MELDPAAAATVAAANAFLSSSSFSSSSSSKRRWGEARTVKKEAGVEEAGASMASFSALSNEVSVVEPLKAAKRDGSDRKKRFEQWVRNDPNEGIVGGLPDELSFDRGGASSKKYKSLMKRFRRSQGEDRETSAYGKGGPSRVQREEHRKQFEVWVRAHPEGGKGELPPELSFDKGGSTTATYKRLNKQYRRVLGRCNKEVTAEELEGRNSAERLKYAEQALECETQVARAVSELTDSDLLRELNARGLECGCFGGGRAQLRKAVRWTAAERLMTAIDAAAAAAAAEEGGDVFSYRAFYAGYVDPHRVPPFGPGCRGEGNGWRSTPVCYICELRCDMFDDHGARFCDMCYQDHHLACDVDPSSAKVAEECNLMLAEDRPTGGGFEFRYANSSNDYYRSHRDSYMEINGGRA